MEEAARQPPDGEPPCWRKQTMSAPPFESEASLARRPRAEGPLARRHRGLAGRGLCGPAGRLRVRVRAAARRRIRPASAGTAAMLAGLLDEGAGQLRFRGFHRALDDKAIELSFSADRDGFTGRLKTLRGTSTRPSSCCVSRSASHASTPSRSSAFAARSPLGPPRERRTRMRSQPAPGARRPSRAIPTAARPAARSSRCRRSTRDDLADLHRGCVRRATP